MDATPWDELEKDLDLAQDWYDSDIKPEKNPQRQAQLRYSLINKLSADWQKFVKGVAKRDGLSETAIKKFGNGTFSGIQNAYANTQLNPLAGFESDYAFFNPFNTVRNAVAHGDEPPMPTLSELEHLMTNLRLTGQIYRRPSR